MISLDLNNGKVISQFYLRLVGLLTHYCVFGDLSHKRSIDTGDVRGLWSILLAHVLSTMDGQLDVDMGRIEESSKSTTQKASNFIVQNM